jgi:hypothetical protein
VLLGLGGELGDQARLANASLAADEDDTRRARHCCRERPVEPRKLLGPADKAHSRRVHHWVSMNGSEHRR